MFRVYLWMICRELLGVFWKLSGFQSINLLQPVSVGERCSDDLIKLIFGAIIITCFFQSYSIEWSFFLGAIQTSLCQQLFLWTLILLDLLKEFVICERLSDSILIIKSLLEILILKFSFFCRIFDWSYFALIRSIFRDKL